MVNETLYSDEFYRGKGGKGGDGDGDDDDDDDAEDRAAGYWHVDLPSLLGGKALSVDVKEWRGWVSIVVNGFAKVVVRDGVADDGVVQVLERVLVPPHGGGKGDDYEGGEISVEELKKRLEPYLKGEGEGGREGMEDL